MEFSGQKQHYSTFSLYQHFLIFCKLRYFLNILYIFVGFPTLSESQATVFSPTLSESQAAVFSPTLSESQAAVFSPTLSESQATVFSPTLFYIP